MRFAKKFFDFLLVGVFAVSSADAGRLKYPETESVDQIDVYHGVEVRDAFRWLEEDVRQSKRVSNWVDAQNVVTFKYLRSLAGREKIEERLTQLWDYKKISVPYKKGGRYYRSENNGLQNHYVTYFADALEGKWRVLFDPNKWSKDGTAALAGMSFSKDGRYVAYGIQQAGSDWRTWKVRDIESGKDLSDELKNLKFTSPGWTADSKGFFYARYPAPKPGEKFVSLNRNMKVMYHRLGTSQSDDVVVLWRPEHPDWGYNVKVTDDGNYLLLTVWVSTDDKYRVIYKDLTEPYSMAIDLISEFENEYSFIDNDGPIFYFKTDYKAPNGRVIAIDTKNPERRNWKEIVPELSEPLQSVNLVSGRFVCSYLKDVTTEIRQYAADGRRMADIQLPALGTAYGFGGAKSDDETFYSFESFTVADTVYRYDFKTGKSILLESPDVDFDPDDYVTERKFYKSKDGTSVPIFINYKKGIPLDGSNPTILYGYGGFNISVLPRFSVSRLVWMEMGGVYAVANIRGGGEYGRNWHEAGKLTGKQNVFDDFISAAEYLINKKYTKSEKLAIHGGSNGGLLVGACLTQRPDLFAAAVPAVGVMDMLRFDEFTAGRFWVDEYGSAKDSREMFEYLRGYSPYHTLKENTAYPATLIVTADTDDRVVPGHSFKFAARLQQCHQGENPVCIRIAKKAGHGSGKPTKMVIEEIADIYSFLAENLEMK